MEPYAGADVLTWSPKRSKNGLRPLQTDLPPQLIGIEVMSPRSPFHSESSESRLPRRDSINRLRAERNRLSTITGSLDEADQRQNHGKPFETVPRKPLARSPATAPLASHSLHHRTHSVDGNISSSSGRHPTDASAPAGDANAQEEPDAHFPQSSANSPSSNGKTLPHSVPHENERPTIPLAQMAQDLRATSSSASVLAEEPNRGKVALPSNNTQSPEPSAVLKPGAKNGTPDRQVHFPNIGRHEHFRRYERSNTELMDEAVLKSISGLERQMQDSIHMANEAARSNNTAEATQILSEAERALEHTAQVAEVQRRRMLEQPLEDSGGGVPWSPVSAGSSDDDNDDDRSTYSVSSSLSEDPAVHIGSVSRGRVNVDDMDDPLSPSQAAPEPTTQSRDFAITADVARQSGLGLPDALRKRSTQAHSVPSGIKDAREERLTRNEMLSGPVPRSLTLKPPQASTDSLPAVEPRRLGSTAMAPFGQPRGHNWGRDKYDERDYLSEDALKGKNHVTLRDDQKWSIHHHKRQPISRNWSTGRKRFTAAIACVNTGLVGMIVGIYAGEVPAMQYALNDSDHKVILGNMVLYIGMAISTFLFWPLPLLHGRRPYTLVALAITLPLQFPQAIMVMTRRVGGNSAYMAGLLVPRAISGLALGFAQINFKATLLDLFGASLQSTHPHQELVMVDDVRRHGGGMGLWLGIWTFSFIGSIGLGFLVGAAVVTGLDVAWGFYITVILIAATLFLNVVAPETRRSAHRRTMAEVELPNMNIARRVARGEVKMHVYGDGPKWWWEEVSAGVYLSLKMLDQPGFGLMALYLGWVYGEIVLVIVLLGNLLSVGYRWPPQYVGLGVFAITVGAFLAIPNTKANFFSKSRSHPFRTDSMTFQPRLSWTSHMVRRAAFMILLPLAGLAYTLVSAGEMVHYMAPIVLAGLIGYISNLAIAECHGLIMETFDTSDLQPGANSRHRLQSLQPELKRRRTTYSSYPRVSAGLFVGQTMGFLLAATATGVGGVMTRQVGAQKATGITAGILFGLTLLLTMSLWRFKSVQVIPNSLFADNVGGSSSATDKRDSMASDKSWRAVIIGNPSGKVRRMNLLELGGLSRWTEIRRLNRLLTRTSTQPLNPGWR